MTRGLYVHIPFCFKKCHYCNFVITTDRSPELRRQFLTALEQEAAEARTRYGTLTFETLYLGGGTPSELSVEEMTCIFELLRKHFRFSENPEITCEINPGDIDEEKLRAHRTLGVNRIGLGAQSFNENLLRIINRPHGVREILDAAALLEKLGFLNVSLDLIIRLPGQTLDDVRHSLSQAVSLHVNQVTVYDLEVHEKTVFGVRQKQGRLKLPTSEEHEQMFDLVEFELAEAGYVHYELLSFARPGFESKHNLIYWNNGEYLGLGPGAFSYLRGVRYQFARDVNRYLRKCLVQDWTNDAEDHLTEEEKETETLLTGLRLKEGVDLNRFRLIRERIEQRTIPFLEEQLMARTGSRIYLTARGRRVAEKMFQELIADGNGR